jgi:hypothetical protein
MTRQSIFLAKMDHRVTARSLCPDGAKRRSGCTGPAMTLN